MGSISRSRPWRRCGCQPMPCWPLYWALDTKCPWIWGPIWSRSKRSRRRRWVLHSNRQQLKSYSNHFFITEYWNTFTNRLKSFKTFIFNYMILCSASLGEANRRLEEERWRQGWHGRQEEDVWGRGCATLRDQYFLWIIQQSLGVYLEDCASFGINMQCGVSFLFCVIKRIHVRIVFTGQVCIYM